MDACPVVSAAVSGLCAGQDILSHCPLPGAFLHRQWSEERRREREGRRRKKEGSKDKTPRPSSSLSFKHLLLFATGALHIGPAPSLCLLPLSAGLQLTGSTATTVSSSELTANFFHARALLHCAAAAAAQSRSSAAERRMSMAREGRDHREGRRRGRRERWEREVGERETATGWGRLAPSVLPL